MTKRLLLTGGAGFVGCHTIEHFLRKTDYEIVVMDRLTYAGNLNRLSEMECWEEEKGRVKFIYHDFRATLECSLIKMIGDIDFIIHMGAESHVDRSIVDPKIFAESNVIGTVNMLEYAKRIGVEKFVYIGTDEVYGAVSGDQLHKEGESHRPSNPYSASKAGAEDFCYSYWNTYGMPIIRTSTMNMFGERQSPEKFVPKTMLSIWEDEPVILHCKRGKGNEIQDISSRCWLHARNHADALLFLLDKGIIGEQYNIVGEKRTVEEMAYLIADFMNKPYQPEFVDFHSFRPGHDMHYGLDGTKMKELGWIAPMPLEKSLQHCVEWSLKNPKWFSI